MGKFLVSRITNKFLGMVSILCFVSVNNKVGFSATLSSWKESFFLRLDVHVPLYMTILHHSLYMRMKRHVLKFLQIHLQRWLRYDTVFFVCWIMAACISTKIKTKRWRNIIVHFTQVTPSKRAIYSFKCFFGRRWRKNNEMIRRKIIRFRKLPKEKTQ